MVILRPMTDEEFTRWWEGAIRDYAADHVTTGRWSEEEAIARALYEKAGYVVTNIYMQKVLGQGGAPQWSCHVLL